MASRAVRTMPVAEPVQYFLTAPHATDFSDRIHVQRFSYKEINFKMSYVKRQPLSICLDVLNEVANAYVMISVTSFLIKQSATLTDNQCPLVSRDFRHMHISDKFIWHWLVRVQHNDIITLKRFP